MEITRKDRWILRNQFLILEGLAESEEDREYWDMCREIVENGYEYHYEWISERIIEDTLSMDESEEVLDILSMFSRLVTTYGRLSREDREEIVNPNTWAMPTSIAIWMGGDSKSSEASVTATSLNYLCTEK